MQLLKSYGEKNQNGIIYIKLRAKKFAKTFNYFVTF